MAGRPTKFDPARCEEIRNYCLLGATDIDLAAFLEVDVATIERWKKDHADFAGSVKAGKEIADARVAQSLYHRALGYSHPEDKIFNDQGAALVVPTTKHYPPDPTACIFWLKNRQRDKWRDKQDVEHTGSVEIRKIERVVVEPDK